MSTPLQWLENTRDWLDGHGKPAWISAMVLGFIFLWPVGLVILFYMIGTNRMGKYSKCRHSRRRGFSSTGNAAFDSYRDETMRRLEDEQGEFNKFMEQLRAAKDKAEFDQFMDNRAKQSFDVDDAQTVPEAPRADTSRGYSGTPSMA